MSASPSAATCARCSAPLVGWTDACSHCGYVSGMNPSPTAAPAPSASAVAQPPSPNMAVPAVPAMPARPPYPHPMMHVVSAKSPGVAVLLSFIWLGAGHLYVGKIGLGIGLMVLDFFLVMLSLIPFTWIITVPVWLITFVFVAIHVSNESKAFNFRNGIIVR
jgi:TM2 domain-containing membrane protein YozV